MQLSKRNLTLLHLLIFPKSIPFRFDLNHFFKCRRYFLKNNVASAIIFPTSGISQHCQSFTNSLSRFFLSHLKFIRHTSILAYHTSIEVGEEAMNASNVVIFSHINFYSVSPIFLNITQNSSTFSGAAVPMSSGLIYLAYMIKSDN